MSSPVFPSKLMQSKCEVLADRERFCIITSRRDSRVVLHTILNGCQQGNLIMFGRATPDIGKSLIVCLRSVFGT